jgi:threonine dehydratase
VSSDVFPVSFADVLDAARRLRPFLAPTPLRRYAPLDAAVGCEVWVKHENHQPTGSFKARNNLSALTALAREERARGVVAATRGNHGLGLAHAGRILDSPVTICVPVGNNPEKNEAVRGLGATLIEEGRDYDSAVQVAERLVAERGLTMVHSTNNRSVIAGAGTVALELLTDESRIDALVVPVGGGSLAVGTLVAARTLAPQVAVYGVQAERASAIHDSFHAGRPLSRPSADTFADGLATRNTYPMTLGALCAGLAGFVTVSEAELAEAVRLYLRTTHNLAEGAGAAALAGLIKLRDRLAGKRVGIVLSGANIDEKTLRAITTREI